MSHTYIYIIQMNPGWFIILFSASFIYVICVFLRIGVSNTLCFFVQALCLMYPMLQFSVDCPFLIAPSGFSNVYLPRHFLPVPSRQCILTQWYFCFFIQLFYKVIEFQILTCPAIYKQYKKNIRDYHIIYCICFCFTKCIILCILYTA